jgi:NitT/TauT family transport system substrate-binding protein
MKKAFALALWLASLGAASTLPFGIAQAQETKVIRFGLPVESVDGLAIYVAQQRGFFKEQGLRDEVTVLRGGTGVIQALVSEDIDIGVVGPMEASLLKDKGVDARLLMTTLAAAQFTLLARKDIGISTLSALKGHSLGVVSPGSLTYGLARYFLLKAGLQPDRDVTIVSLGGGAEMSGALKSKKVDALLIFEPFASTLLADGSAISLIDVGEEIRDFPVFAMVVKKPRADADPELFRRTGQALVSALQFIQSNPEDARKVAFAKFPTMNQVVMNRALDKYIPAFSKDGVITPDMMRSSQEILKAAGLIQTVRPYDEMILRIQ